jgi:CRISPR type III-B/RAMP module-associated protein Cmr3
VTGSSWLAFTPRDTVFVRDGRSFDAATDAVAQTVWPGPTTIAGAVGAAFGGNNPAEVRGPVLARRHEDAWEPYFPVPADLVVTADEPERVFRLRPEGTGETDLGGEAEGLRWLMPPEDAEPVKPLRGWLPGRVLAGYLAGNVPGPDGVPLPELEVTVPVLPERRVGLARDGRRARNGYLYQATHLRPRDGWGFLAEYIPPEQQDGRRGDHGPFGGRGRLADIEGAAASWPDAGTAIGSRVLVYLATPALWPGGWRLPAQDGARLIAAATGEPEPAATVKPGPGWKDSRVLRWAVPAGSVYLLEFADPASGTRWARERKGKALERGTSEEPDLLRTAGFGVVLTGAWT